jgi:small subunit ribosomal protein S21
VVWFLPKVVLRPGESQGSLLKRFRKKVARSKVLSTVRQKRWFISTSEARRIAKQKAIRKQQRRLTERKGGPSSRPKPPTTFHS